jgi:hypothetical protein
MHDISIACLISSFQSGLSPLRENRQQATGPDSHVPGITLGNTPEVLNSRSVVATLAFQSALIRHGLQLNLLNRSLPHEPRSQTLSFPLSYLTAPTCGSDGGRGSKFLAVQTVTAVFMPIATIAVMLRFYVRGWVCERIWLG